MKPDIEINGRYFVGAEILFRNLNDKKFIYHRKYNEQLYTGDIDQSLPLGKCWVELQEIIDGDVYDVHYIIKFSESGKAVVLTGLPKLENKEYILCAAIWYKEIPLVKEIQGVLPKNCNKGLVVTGYRHCHCMWIMGCLTGLRSVEAEVGEYVQGFLTSWNRFVDREEGRIIANIAGQTTKTKGQLFSEDLY